MLETYFTEFVDSICKIFEVYRFEGKLDKAILLFDSIKPILDSSEIKEKDIARTLIEFAKIRMDNKFLKDFDYEEEFNLLKEAQMLAESSNAKNIQAEAIDLYGNCIYRKGILNGDFEEALTYYKRALFIRNQINDKLGLSKSYFHLGIYHENKKDANETDHQTALEYYEKGLKIAKEEDFKLEQSYFFRHIAGIYAYIKEDLDKGLEYFKKSTHLREYIGMNFNLQFAYFAEAFVYFLKNDMDNARNYFIKAYSAAIKVRRIEALKVLIFRRGDAIVREINLESALKYYEIILDVANKINDNDGIKEIKLKLEDIRKSV